MDVLAATDFFTTEVWTLRGLVRYHIHFVIDMATRKVKVTHISCQWCGKVMEQVARQMVDAIDGPLLTKRYLIMDRDPLYTTAVRKVLTDAGINLVRCPPQKPVVNIYAERFVKSIKNECTDKLIFFGEKSLRYAISEYIEHYNSERNHQGISNKLIDPKPGTTTEEHGSDVIDFQELIVKSGRLGGLLNFYQRKAA